jgi:cyanobactin biosynthesis protein (PatB/AcyB/McaB family)
MYQPIQAPPVRRPDLVDPLRFYLPNIDCMTQEQLTDMKNNLSFDTNFNDPQAFVLPSADRMRLSCWPGR